jgi:hypothetical protein
MNASDQAIRNIRPDLRKRECGGWIAVTPASAPLSIGVTASTEDDARKQFAEAAAGWAELLGEFAT